MLSGLLPATAAELNLLPAAEFAQMNFTQMHERLRLELQRRIQRGTLSVSLLARQTGFGQSHLSNFLHSHRQLSLEAMDRILAAQNLGVADLMPAIAHASWPDAEDIDNIPLVSHATAMFEPFVRPSAVHRVVHVPAGLLRTTRSRATSARRSWRRFVAINVSAGDAEGMEPVLLPEAIVLLDRHYNSLSPYRPGRANLYAVRHDARLVVRYVDFQLNRLLLRPHNMDAAVLLAEIDPHLAPGDLIAGRVVLVLNQV